MGTNNKGHRGSSPTIYYGVLQEKLEGCILGKISPGMRSVCTLRTDLQPPEFREAGRRTVQLMLVAQNFKMWNCSCWGGTSLGKVYVMQV